jgi:hypothetical protein
MQVDRDKKISLNNSSIQSFKISQIYTKIKTTMIIMMKEFFKNTNKISTNKKKEVRKNENKRIKHDTYIKSTRLSPSLI